MDEDGGVNGGATTVSGSLVVYPESPVRSLVGLLAIAAGLLLLGVVIRYLQLPPPGSYVGMFTIGLAVLLCVVAAIAAFRSRWPIYRLDAVGVEFLPWAIGRIPWRDVMKIEYATHGRQAYLLLTFHEEECWFRRVSWWRRLLFRYRRWGGRASPLYLALHSVSEASSTIQSFVLRACGCEVVETAADVSIDPGAAGLEG